jgi:hypothetical protein
MGPRRWSRGIHGECNRVETVELTETRKTDGATHAGAHFCSRSLHRLRIPELLRRCGLSGATSIGVL